MKLRILVPTVLLAIGGWSLATAASGSHIDVYKSPYCGCCEKWVEHLRRQGFDVAAHDTDDIPAKRRALGMPDAYGSCHVAKVGNYVIEGHVPGADIQQLLKTKPKAIGLAVPSMPPGSPGMESGKAIPFNTLLINDNGSSSVFARH